MAPLRRLLNTHFTRSAFPPNGIRPLSFRPSAKLAICFSSGPRESGCGFVSRTSSHRGEEAKAGLRSDAEAGQSSSSLTFYHWDGFAMRSIPQGVQHLVFSLVD